MSTEIHGGLCEGNKGENGFAFAVRMRIGGLLNAVATEPSRHCTCGIYSGDLKFYLLHFLFKARMH